MKKNAFAVSGTSPTTKESEARTSLLRKLSPQNVRLSPKMRYLIDSITGQDHGARGPKGEAPGHLIVTSDGYFLASHGNMFVTAMADFERNIEGLSDCVELTAEERVALRALMRENIADCRSRFGIQDGTAVSR